MISKLITGVILSLLLLTSEKSYAQSSWDWRDPNDFVLIDLGDNKLIGYNLIGLGLSLWLDKTKKVDSTLVKEIFIGGYREYDRSPISNLWVIEGKLGQSIRKYLSIGSGMKVYMIKGAGVNTLGLGGYLWFGWHIIRKKKWRFIYDNGIGPNYFFEAFPEGGTRLNFTTHYGLTIEFLLNDRWAKIKFSNIHISNAGIRGRDRNPALDAIGIQIGYGF